MNTGNEKLTASDLRFIYDDAKVRRATDDDTAMGLAIVGLIFCLIIAIIGLFAIGIDSMPMGYLFFAIMIIIGLLPIILVANGGFQGLKENFIAWCKAPRWPFPKGFFSTCFLAILYILFHALKVIFIVFYAVFIIVLFASCKPADRRMYEGFLLSGLLIDANRRR